MPHKNVYLTIIASALLGLADSIWTNTILTTWLYLLANNSHANSQVGSVEAAQGIAQLVTALPIGYLADKWARSPVIKMGCVISAIACTSTLFGIIENGPLHLNSDGQFYVLLASMCLWGINSGVFNGPIQALFADSIPAGERSKWYTYLMTAYIVPSVVGPILTVVFFQIYGDHWTFEEMRPIFITGVCMEIIPAILTLFLQDIKKETPLGPSAPPVIVDVPSPSSSTSSTTSLPYSSSSAALETKKTFCITRKMIPAILFGSSLMSALGSGMSVKFFPLFFKSQLAMSPSQVQTIYALTPISMALLSVLATSVAARIGRVQVSVYFQLLGICFLVSMAVGIDEYASWISARPWLMAGVYIVRTGLMNCTYPLQESIMMDCVPASSRARWKSLEAIGVLGWSGSAFLGGILADKYSYSRTFLFTAGFQFASCLILALIIRVVPISEKQLEAETQAARIPEASLQAPLLSVTQDE